MDAYVKKELRYPKEALQNKIEGRVSVQYTVDYKGKVIEARVISGLGYGCDEEALRIVRSLPFKVPDHGKVKSKYSRKLHIHFRLPGSKTKNDETKKLRVSPSPAHAPSGNFQVQYQVTPSKPQKENEKPGSSSYQITITIPGRTRKK